MCSCAWLKKPMRLNGSSESQNEGVTGTSEQEGPGSRNSMRPGPFHIQQSEIICSRCLRCAIVASHTVEGHDDVVYNFVCLMYS